MIAFSEWQDILEQAACVRHFLGFVSLQNSFLLKRIFDQKIPANTSFSEFLDYLNSRR
jgi:hypothetical protein